MTSNLESRSQNQRPTLDPIVTLQVPLGSSKGAGSNDNTTGNRFSVSSVCFLPGGISSDNHDSQSDDSDDSISSSDEEPTFRCRDLVQQETRHEGDITADARSTAASLSLSGTRLVSCHSNGDAFVWDLGRRRIVSNLLRDNRGQGMALRRLGEATSTKFLYQTRDLLGTVSIHDAETTDIVTAFETRSLSFCSSAPCGGNNSLVVLPTQHRCYATVRDIRISPESPPIITFHGACLDDSENDDAHGMLMSLAMSEARGEESGNPVVSCGMESGTVFYHDLRLLSRALEEKENTGGSVVGSCSIKLGKDPVLGLDLASSAPTSANGKNSFVTIAGMAGDAADLSELPIEERGTVAVIKTSFGAHAASSARLRARVATCQVAGPDESIRGGKPGVSVCRFRPGGRVFGVGGWDRRVRIFDRSGNVEPLAILKGHTDSVTALDWAPDSTKTGFLATGAGDGRIYIWRCFPS